MLVIALDPASRTFLIGFALRCATSRMMSAPSAPIAPASVAVRMPVKMPPKITAISTTRGQIHTSDDQRSAQVERSPPPKRLVRPTHLGTMSPSTTIERPKPIETRKPGPMPAISWGPTGVSRSPATSTRKVDGGISWPGRPAAMIEPIATRLSYPARSISGMPMRESA